MHKVKYSLECGDRSSQSKELPRSGDPVLSAPAAPPVAIVVIGSYSSGPVEIVIAAIAAAPSKIANSIATRSASIPAAVPGVVAVNKLSAFPIPP
jgi:hypothetical protein